MDHGNAQSTFVELAFGINTLFAAYKGLRDRVFVSIQAKMEEAVALVQSLETNSNPARVAHVKVQIEAYGKQHIDFQKDLSYRAPSVSCLGAFACLVVTYFDWFAQVGYWNAILILPFPAYGIATGANYGIFKFRCRRKVSRLESYLREFEPPPQPPVSGLPPPFGDGDDNGSPTGG